jgi:hypothetical protein
MKCGIEASDLRDSRHKITQCIDCLQRRGVVEGREVVHLVELGSDRDIDHDGMGEPSSPVDHSVADGVDRSGRHQEATQVVFQRVARWVEVDGVGHTIVAFHDTELEAGRSGVRDEYPHVTVLARLESA